MYRSTGSYLALCFALTSCVTTGRSINPQRFTLGSQSPPPLKAPSPNVPAVHVLTLTTKPGASRSAGYLQSLRKGPRVDGVYSLAAVDYVAKDQILVANLTIGTQSFQAEIDTGSSDTWVAGKGFQCVDYANTTQIHQPESACMFGPTYNISPEFRRIQNENFHLLYGDGSMVMGFFGYETLTLAGIPVPNQQFAVANVTSLVSDGVTSGFIGLSFPASTRAFAGTDPDEPTKQIPYNPILTNVFSRPDIAPVFSLAIERSPTTSGVGAGGFLAIGGLPPVRHSPNFARAPIQLVTVDSNDKPLPVPQHQLYTIVVTGFRYEGSEATEWTHPPLPDGHRGPAAQPVCLTTRPSSTAEPVLMYVRPCRHRERRQRPIRSPGRLYDSDAAAYTVDCEALPPEFGVRIGELVFDVDGRDLVFPPGGGGGACVSGVQDAGGGVAV